MNLYRDIEKHTTEQINENKIELECSNKFKSVQTSFSSIDLLATRQCCHCHRKIKSQEDIRARTDIPNDLIKWIKEAYSDKVSTKYWNDRMKKLAQKLSNPEGEEKIRENIRGFLKNAPSPLDCDEEQKEFREQLPDIIINKLKKMYLKTERRKHSSPIRIYRIEIPTTNENDNNKNELRKVIQNWLNDVPIKKRDFLNRSIKRDDVLNFIVKQLEPHIDQFNIDKNKSIIQHIIKNLLEEIPMQKDGVFFLNELATSLVDDLYKTETVTANPDKQVGDKYINDHKSRTLKNFISCQIDKILQKVNKTLDTRQLRLLKDKIIDIFVNILNFKCDINESIQKKVHDIFLNLGGFNIFQSQYFGNKLIKHFIKQFCESCNTDEDEKQTTGIASSDTYPVLSENDNDNKEISVSYYKQQIMEQIEAWLEEFPSHILLFPDKGAEKVAVKDLAEDIVDRFKYLDMNPGSSYENEIQYLKYQIFKWINKVIGDDKLEITNRAHELMTRIQSINVPKLVESVDEAHFDLRNSFFQRSLSLSENSQLYEESILHQQKELTNFDSKRHRRQIRMYEDIIDDWLDTDLFDNHVELFQIRKRNEFIYELAVKLLNTQNVCNNIPERDLIIKMKEIVSEWSTKVLVYINQDVKFTEHCILKLVHAIQDCKIDNDDYNILKQDYCTQIVLALKSWLNTLLLYENANACEKRRLKEVISNLANSLSIINADPSTQILKFVRTVSHSNDEEITKQNADNLQTYLQELNLYTEGLNEDDCNGPAKKNDYQENELPDPEINKMTATHVTVYGFTLPSNLDKVESRGGQDTQDDSIKPITDADIEANQDIYAKRLVKEIDEWLNSLNIPQIHDKGFREIVVNDLAGDIIDRQKYLELNPSGKKTDADEVEHLRYQIFKWINKLVDEERQETLQHASELMDRIKSVPVPMFANRNNINQQSLSQSNFKTADTSNNQLKKSNTTSNNTGNLNATNVRLSTPLGFTTGPMATASKQNVNPLSIFGSKGPGGHIKQRTDSPQGKRLNGSAAIGISMKNEQANKESSSNPKKKVTEDKSESVSLRSPYTSLSSDNHNTLLEELQSLPQGMSLQELYAHFGEIFKSKIQELPLETPTPDQERLVNLARVGIYNGIWKTFYTFLDDPDIVNDYCLFDLLFEERLDNMLDCLPQTQEMQRIRPAWKSHLLNNILLMLKYVHSITDKPNIRELILMKVNRQMLRNMNVSHAEKVQHCFVARTADGYILSTHYKDDDPIRANVYRQRLMKRLEEMAENIKYQNKMELADMDPSQLCKLAFKLLGDVPIPDKEELKEEAEEILLGEEIEEWYKDLPIKPIKNEDNAHLRKRLREILAKRLRDLEKKMDAFGDPSLEIERNMKHEISNYLEHGAELKQVNDLNINFMVEELTERIKNRRQQNFLGYEAFEKENPASSTFVQMDPGEIMAPLVNIEHTSNNHSGMNSLSVPSEEFGRPQGQSRSLPYNGIPGPDPTVGSGRFSLPSAGASCCQHQFCLNRNTSTGGSQGYAVANDNVLPVPQSTPKRQLSPTSRSEEVGQSCSLPSNVIPRAGATVGSGIFSLPTSGASCCQHQFCLNRNTSTGGSQGYDNILPGPIPHSTPKRQLSPTPRAEEVGMTNSGPSVQGVIPSMHYTSKQVENDQVHLLTPGHFIPGQSSQGPSTGFLNTSVPGVTGSTARMVTGGGLSGAQVPNEEELVNNREHVKYKCHCMERLYMCSRGHYFDDIPRYPPCYPPVPFPRCYY